MTLPKFLLAWSDFNWLWLYAKLRPAKDARWTFTRTLGLTLLTAGLAAFAGLLLGLAAYRQPVGWLPWLLGLWWGCIGLCWFGVTGICWNQRATALRADPALPTTLPRSRFRFGRWCLGAIYIAVLGIITPLALVVTVENIRGEIAWKRERARLIAAGEKLTFREILGPEIPADQNAGAAPIFAPFFDYRRDNAPSIWRSDNALTNIENAFRLPWDHLPEPIRGEQNSARPLLVNIPAWADAFREASSKPKRDEAVWAGELKLPPDGSPARVVLAGLSRSEQGISEICSASSLPRAQFPIHHDEAFDALLRHLGLLRSAQENLKLRCAAHFAAGEAELAFADATNALNLAEILREEPVLISQFVRYKQVQIALGTVWQGLAEHRWSDAQLAQFSRQIGRFDELSGLVLAFEGERALGVVSMERLVNESSARTSVLGESPSIAPIMKTVTRGMVRHNQTALTHYQSVTLLGLRNGLSAMPQEGLSALIRSGNANLENLFGTSPSPFNAIARALEPATGKAWVKTARAQTTVQLAIVACALERHRIAHGSYPETLDALASQFAAGVPLDPMVSKPFRYSRTDDGWFLLYSVGPNGTDDGGVMRADDKKDSQDKDWPWPVPTRPAKVRLF